MLPVSTWPPSTPGSDLAPFGLPMTINVGNQPPWGWILRKGAWLVQTSSNQVMFNVPGVTWNNPTRAPGTGFLPGQPDPAPLPPCPGFPPAPVTPPPGTPCNCGCGNLTQAWAPNWANPPAAGQAASPAALATSPPPWTWQTWQAFIDANGFPPPAGSQPPNWFGWYCVTPVMTMTLVGPMSSGLVLADGQNVSIQGSGNANIVEVFSV